MREDGRERAEGWPLRIGVLAALGTFAGLAVRALLDGTADLGEPAGGGQIVRHAAATFIGIASLVFAHMWNRREGVRAAAAAMAGGLVVGLVHLWNGTPEGGWSDSDQWRFVAALISLFLFVPLAQAVERADAGRWPVRWRYDEVHDHAWTNVLTFAASLLFAGLFYLMLLLLAEMFGLIGITLLRRLLDNGYVGIAIFGGAVGASTAVLRDRRAVLSSLQAVVMAVFRFAAPVVALGLALFVAALPFTGLEPLWDATRATTPIVLSAAILALLLVNSVLGAGRDDEARARVLRWSAMVLALGLLPLAVIAAWSTGLRVGQYGWTPERLWAAVFVGLGLVTAVVYASALIVGRARWTERLRGANLALALVVCGIAVLLSTPLVRFDAIATRSQIARLERGKISPEAFDYRSLWFQFGPAGRAAIRRLARDAPAADVRRYARAVQSLESRWAEAPNEVAKNSGAALDSRLTILPRPVALPERLRERLIGLDACAVAGECTLHYRPGEPFAIVVRQAGVDCRQCAPVLSLLKRGPDGRWPPPGDVTTASPIAAKDRAAAVRAGHVSSRDVTMRQVLIDGEPFGDPIALENSAAP